MKKVLSQVEKSILSTKKIKREAELTLLSLCEKLGQSDSSNFSDFFSSEMQKVLSTNIKKLKHICDYADDEKKINFNAKEFMLMDLLLLLFELVKREKEHGLADCENLKKGIHFLEAFIQQGFEPKSDQYYLELRKKILLWKNWFF